MFKFFRRRSLDAIMAGYQRTIADLDHFAKDKQDLASETRGWAQQLASHVESVHKEADGHEEEARKARAIQGKLAELAA